MSAGETGNGTWSDRANSTVADITNDVATVRSFITNIVAAAGNNSIYRGIFFPVEFSNSGLNAQVSPILASDGLNATGGVTANGFSSTYNPPATAYSSSQTLYPESSGSPTYLTYRGSAASPITDGSGKAYYYGQVKIALNDIGYSLV